jgi:hypothetical protein
MRRFGAGRPFEIRQAALLETLGGRLSGNSFKVCEAAFEGA